MRASAATAITSLAASLAELTFDDLSSAARHSALRCVLDLVACTSAGRSHWAVSNSARWARGAFPRGNSSVWFDAEPLSPLGAAFINSLAASVRDLDDGHRLALGHPGAAVVPAVVAVGETIGARFQDVLLAIVCGYEAGISVAHAREPSLLRNLATGRWSTVAVAAAIAKLRGLSATELAHAIALAEAHAPNVVAADHAGFTGSDMKEGIPWSALTGMAAAEQAVLGLKGYLGALDNPAVYRTGVEPRCNNDRFFIETTYFKPYACCRWIHSAIDAILDLRNCGVDPLGVEEIEVATFQRALSLGNLVRPNDLISAQFSIPFVLAVALLEGADALLPMSPDLLGRADVIEMAGRVVLVLDRELEASFPARVPARLKVKTRRGTVEREVRDPLGDPLNPMSDSRLVEKAIKLCSQDGTVEEVRKFAGNLLGWTAAQRAAEPLSATLAFTRGKTRDR
ncbi:MAG: MmgE/PrpD family protein [Steroidobacteraceae bacterium]